jgi:hypothetical protein
MKRMLVLAGGALAVFHGWLFVSQAAAGRLGDPWVIVRWAAAIALVAALARLHRRGHVLWGRKGISIWLLAAMLHGPALADNASFDTFALPEAAVASVLQLMSSTALALGLWKLAALLAARRTTRYTRGAVLPILAAASGLTPGHAPQFSPRPPPLRS